MAIQSPRPIAALPLAMPAGIMGGFVIVALGYRLSQVGIPVERSARLISIFFLMQALRFLWAPLIDATLTRVRWYLVGWILTIGAILGMSNVAPSARTIPLTAALVWCGAIGAATVLTAIEGLIATRMPESLKGQAGGWEWAGVFSGNCIGGGIGLWLLQHLNGLAASLAIGVGTALCALPLAFGFVAGTTASPHKVERLTSTMRDLMRVVRTPVGLLLLFVCMAPLGAGGAGNLFATVAPDWHASADMVAFVTGGLAPLLTAAGCATGGWASGALGARRGYVVSGVALAAVALAMSAAPRSPATYAGFTMTYQFAFGLDAGALAGLVFATIGGGAACTKCATFLGLASLPGWYMTVLAGVVHDRLGASAMLAVEGCAALASLACLVGIARLLRTSLLAPPSATPIAT